ncbi:MAG: sigma-E factor negative regulatory protein [Methylotenera sp.]|nr:sigma-E factor negative regulatory protein [Methylotenera sp.]
MMTEQISTLADDEMDLDDTEHLLTYILANSQNAEAWSRYHLIGDVMRGGGMLSQNFKKNLMSKIELEPTVLSPNAASTDQKGVMQKTLNTHFKMPAAWSIAASFSAVMVVGWMVLQTHVTNNFTPVEIAQLVTTPAKSALMASNEPVLEQAVPAEYLTAHQAYAPTASSYYIQSASYSK